MSAESSLIDFLPGLELGTSAPAASNRCSLEGLAWRSTSDGALEASIRKLEAAALRISSGPFVLELGRIALHQLAVQLRIEAGLPYLSSVEATEAECSGVKLQGPLMLPPELKGLWGALHGQGSAKPAGDTAGRQAAAGAWCLGPLAAADGTIRGEITDAHLLFDADVTVPIRQGQIDFNDATVEHVGPDSRMGVSRLGLYVDAPNGRSYLYQFASAPLDGVEFEQRGALLGPWVSERGRLRLQAFGEALLRQARSAHGMGLTEQARLLLGRTALSGEMQLGDGLFAAPGVQARIAGRSEGRNAVRFHSQAVGSGLSVEMGALSARDAVADWRGRPLQCDEITARLMLQLFVAGPQMRFVLELGNVKFAGVRM